MDRSLGRYDVPEVLRAAGIVTHCLHEHYDNEQTVEDHVWASDAGAKGWAIITSDTRLRYDVGIELLVAHNIGAFYLTRNNLPSAEQCAVIATRLPQMLATWESMERPFLVRFSATVYEVAWAP